MFQSQRIVAPGTPRRGVLFDRSVGPLTKSSQHFLKSRFLHPPPGKRMRIAARFFNARPRIVSSPARAILRLSAEPMHVLLQLRLSAASPRNLTAVATGRRTRQRADQVIRSRTQFHPRIGRRRNRRGQCDYRTHERGDGISIRHKSHKRDRANKPHNQNTNIIMARSLARVQSAIIRHRAQPLRGSRPDTLLGTWNSNA